MVRVSACHEKIWTHFPCLKLSLAFAKKIGYLFWEFEFFNVAKFPALARLIIRYSALTLLQNVKFLFYKKNSGESISYPFAFGIEGLSNSIYRRLFSFTKSHKGPEKVCVEKISSRRRGILCVEKIRSRPRGILCVDKIGSVPPDRRSPGDHPFPLSKIDQWAILLRGNGAITFAITFFPSRFLRPGRLSCFAPHRHTRTVDH